MGSHESGVKYLWPIVAASFLRAILRLKFCFLEQHNPSVQHLNSLQDTYGLRFFTVKIIVFSRSQGKLAVHFHRAPNIISGYQGDFPGEFSIEKIKIIFKEK